jgi:tetratricopeptide (TPR) repeat protein
LYEITGFVHEAGNYCMKLLEKNNFPDEGSRAKIQSISATLFYNMDNIPEALKYVNESLIVFRKLNMKLNIVKSLNLLFSISNINLSTGNENNYLEEALALCRENNFKNELVTTLYNFSFAEGIADNIKLKKKYRVDALKLSREINDTTMIITILASTGILETRTGDKDKARSYFEESFSLAKQMNNQNFISINLSGLGNIFLKEKDFANAEYYLNESVRSSKEYGLISSYPLLKNLAGMYNEIGDNEKALMSYRESSKYGLKFGSNYFTKEILIGAGISYFNSDQPELSLKMFCMLNSLQRDIKDPYSLETYNEKSQSYILKLRDSLGDETFEKYQTESDNIDKINIERHILELIQ